LHGFFLADNDQYEGELDRLPECGSERTDHCEGNVAKYGVSDDQKLRPIFFRNSVTMNLEQSATASDVSAGTERGV